MGPFTWQSPLVHILVPNAHGLMCLTTLSSLHIPASLSERKPARLAAACYQATPPLQTQHKPSESPPSTQLPSRGRAPHHHLAFRARAQASPVRTAAAAVSADGAASLDAAAVRAAMPVVRARALLHERRAAPRGDERVHLYLRVLLQRTAGAHACWPSFSTHGALPHPSSPRACQAGPLLALVLRPRATATGATLIAAVCSALLIGFRAPQQRCPA